MIWQTRYMSSATALAHPNIAFIKYRGNRDNALRLPSNGSISMNLDGFFTRTTVMFSASFKTDSLCIGERPVTGPGLERISRFLGLVDCLMALPAFVVLQDLFRKILVS
jgi:diphosphomevalonate decarboxylase